MAKKKTRKVNVEMPGLEDFEVPPDAPPEAADAMKLMQKAYTDPDGLSEEELAKFMEIADALNAAEEAAIDPEDRKQAAALGARAFDKLQAGDLDEAFKISTRALDLDPREPAADLVNAMLGIEDDQETFEAMGAISMQVDFEMRRDPEDDRAALLHKVRNIANTHAGLAAFQCGHFESAIGPLAETLESGDEENASAAALFLLAALIGNDEGESALDLIEYAEHPHQVMQWGKVLALLLLKREDDAAKAFKAAMKEAPTVYEYLITKPPTDERRQELLQAQDQDLLAAHLFATVFHRQKALRKKLIKLAP